MSSVKPSTPGLSSCQKSLTDYAGGWKVIRTRPDGDGQVQLQQCYTIDGRVHFSIMYVDDEGEHLRGSTCHYKYALKAFYKAGKRVWV